MSVELEVRVSNQTTNLEIENCIRETVQRLFGDEEAQRLSFDMPNGGGSRISDMVIRLDDVAAVSAEFFDFNDADSEESGNWCTLSANLDRNQNTYALMCIIAGTLADQFNTTIVDDALWLGTTREIAPAELENRIRDHTGNGGLQEAASSICRSLGIGDRQK